MASAEQIISKCWANALQEPNGSKCWANAQQVLSKYSSSAEQILSKCWANAPSAEQLLRKYSQVLSKYSSSAEQILIKCWANTHQVLSKSFLLLFFLTTRRPEQITAPQNNTVSISRHFKHFIFLLSKFFCWANFLLSKCSASTEQMLSKYWANTP